MLVVSVACILLSAQQHCCLGQRGMCVAVWCLLSAHQLQQGAVNYKQGVRRSLAKDLQTDEHHPPTYPMCWGFFRPKDQYVSEKYHQLLIRWFQFGVFTPIFRVHGCGTHTEIWNFGNETMKAINTSAITLRYRPGWSCHVSFLVGKYIHLPIWFIDIQYIFSYYLIWAYHELFLPYLQYIL